MEGTIMGQGDNMDQMETDKWEIEHINMTNGFIKLISTVENAPKRAGFMGADMKNNILETLIKEVMFKDQVVTNCTGPNYNLLY